MFGVPLVTLVTSEGADVPKIIRRVVEHVEQYGTVVLSNKTLFISALHFIEYNLTDSCIKQYIRCLSSAAIVLFNAGTH